MPYACWKGFNAGAYEVAQQIDNIVKTEFGNLEVQLLKNSKKYNPRQLIIITHSGGGNVIRAILSDYGNFSPDGTIVTIPTDSGKFDSLKKLFNTPDALKTEDIVDLSEAKPSTPLTDAEIVDFMKWSTNIRRHTAGTAILTSPMLGTPVTRLSFTSFFKMITHGTGASNMCDESITQGASLPGGPLHDEITYPTGRTDLDLFNTPGEGIPVLLIGGRSSESFVNVSDDSGITYHLLPLADKWVSEWKWREPLNQVCEYIDDLICDSLLTRELSLSSISSSILGSDGLSGYCHDLLNSTVGDSTTTVASAIEDTCKLALFGATIPGDLMVMPDGMDNPFNMTGLMPDCDSLSAYMGDVDGLSGVVDGLCSCVVEQECNIDDPNTWWCCGTTLNPMDMLDVLEINGVNVVEEILTPNFSQDCENSAACVSDCVACAFGAGWKCPDCFTCTGSCIAGKRSNTTYDQVMDYISDNTSYFVPSTDMLDAFDMLDPEGWPLDFASFGDMFTMMCNDTTSFVPSLPSEITTVEDELGMSAWDAVCDALNGLMTDYSDGWEGDLFDSNGTSTPTNCDGLVNMDQTTVNYSQVGTAALTELGEQAINLTGSNFNVGWISPISWDSVFHNSSDGLFDNDSMVPIWSQLMCFPNGAGFKDFKNVERHIVYNNHESAKHSDPVAKRISEWLFDKYDADADGIPNMIEGESDVDSDRDGIPDHLDMDSDNDGWYDYEDNCRTIWNIEQQDSDSDGKGDACDKENMCIYANQNIYISDRALVETIAIGANGTAEIGANAHVIQYVLPASSVFLRSSAFVDGHVISGGEISEQNDVTVSGQKIENANIPAWFIPIYTIDNGDVSFEFSYDTVCHGALPPGVYDSIIVRSGCSLFLDSGTYDVSSFELSPDSELFIDDPVHLNIEESLTIGDRSFVSKLSSNESLDPSAFNIYSNKSGAISIGVGSNFVGNIAAPYADITIYPDANYRGCVHANNILIEANATLRGSTFPSPLCGNGSLDDGEECDDGNADNTDNCLTNCRISTCDNGLFDDNIETDVDCGGSCDPCEIGDDCILDFDCVTGICRDELCSEAIDEVSATIDIYSDWDSGYCATVRVTNNASLSTEWWIVTVTSNESEISTLWNGIVMNDTDSIVIHSQSYNGEITPGAEQSFGFCATKTGGAFAPSVLSVLAG